MREILFIILKKNLYLLFKKKFTEMQMHNIKCFRIKLFWFVLVLLPFSIISAQEQKTNFSKSLSEIIDFTELVYGTDDILVNGQPYALKLSDVKGHPFFGDGSWSKENLVVKGKIYNNIELNYDIESDKLILNAKHNKNSFIKIELSDKVIDSFNLKNHHFINSAQLKNNITEAVYFEQVYNGSFYFLIMHNKILNSAYYDTPPFGKYTDMQSVYYIYKDGEMKRLLRKKSFLKYFKKDKKSIRKFMRKNKIKYKKASNVQLNTLMKYCDNLSTE